MTSNPDKPRTHANAGRTSHAGDTADSVVATDDTDDGGSASDVIGVALGTCADRVARPAGDGSNDADRDQHPGGRSGTIGTTTNHAHRTNSFQ